MKALTFTQPWATLTMLLSKRVARGNRVAEKGVDTRPVLYKHRGPLAVHASRELADVWRNEPFASVLAAHGISHPDQFPRVAVVGVVDVIDGCYFTDEAFPYCLPSSWRLCVGPYEAHFGDYRVGRGGLLLCNQRPLALPIKTRGWPGLWDWTPPSGVSL